MPSKSKITEILILQALMGMLHNIILSNSFVPTLFQANISPHKYINY